MSAHSAEALSHVQDSTTLHLPGGAWELRQVVDPEWIPETLRAYGIEGQFTRFMLMEVVVAVLMVAVFVPLARRIATGECPRGRFWNFFELLLVFVRDEVARRTIGSKEEADRFLPFIWTLFFFILFSNLVGLLPLGGPPTAALGCTATLAMMTFLTVVGTGIRAHGILGFWTGLVPHMDVPWVIGVFIVPMLFAIELLGLCIKHFVLSVRLLANMFAGHLVLAVIMGFIAIAAEYGLGVWSSVTVATLLGALALNLLELFVAFLQAYIFTFLSALFIGMAIHQH